MQRKSRAKRRQSPQSEKLAIDEQVSWAYSSREKWFAGDRFCVTIWGSFASKRCHVMDNLSILFPWKAFNANSERALLQSNHAKRAALDSSRNFN